METEPKPAASPSAPIMDVAPPAKGEPSLAKPPQETEPAETPAIDAVAPPRPPKPVKASTAPVVVILLSALCFLILSGLAYYAYTKAQ